MMIHKSYALADGEDELGASLEMRKCDAIRILEQPRTAIYSGGRIAVSMRQSAMLGANKCHELVQRPLTLISIWTSHCTYSVTQTRLTAGLAVELRAV